MGKNFSGNTNKERPKSDFYQTPYSMTEQLLQNEEFIGNVLEPSCGKGAISKVLKEHNFEVTAQDYDEGLGIDFLKFNKKFDNIITNPPFRLANEFVKKSLELPIGTYFYFIEYTDENHQKQRKIGWLYLKK